MLSFDPFYVICVNECLGPLSIQAAASLVNHLVHSQYTAYLC